MALTRRSAARTDTATPPTRRRRPTWRDPRLAGGVALIGVSVALGSWAVDAAADTQQVYVLARDVAPGQDLAADGVLTLVDARPGTDAYVTAGQLPATAVAQRSMRAGELLPTGAVGQTSPADLRPVVLTLSSGLPSGTVVGDGVDLWTLPDARTAAGNTGGNAGGGAPAGDGGGADVVAQGLTVASIGKDDHSLLGSTTVEVEVLVPADSVSAVLTAVGEGGPLVLVPSTGR